MRCFLFLLLSSLLAGDTLADDPPNVRRDRILRGLAAVEDALPASDPFEAGVIGLILPDVQAQLGCLPEALNSVDSLKEESDRHYVLRKIAVTCDKNGDIDAAVAVAKRAEADPKVKHGIIAAVAEQAARSGKWQQAGKLIDHIKDQKGKGLASLNLSVVASKSGKTTEAGDYLEQATDNLHQLPQTEDILFHTALAYSYAGDVKALNVLLPKLEKAVDPRFKSRLDWYNRCLSRGLARSGHFKDSIALAKKISQVNEYDQDDAYRYVVKMQLRKGDIEGAKAIALSDRFTENFWHDRLLMKIVRAEIERGKYQEALELARKMTLDENKAQGLLAIANECERAESPSNRMLLNRIFQELREAIDKPSGPEKVAFDSESKALILVRLGKYYVRHQESAKAAVELKAAIAASKKVDYSMPFAGTELLEKIANLQLLLKDYSGARKTLDFTWKTTSAQHGNDEFALAGYKALVPLYVKAGQVERVVSLTMAVPSGFQTDVFAEIATAEFAQSEDLDDVIKRISSTVPKSMRAYVLMVAVQEAVKSLKRTSKSAIDSCRISR